MTASEFINGLPAKVKEGVLEGLSTLFHFDIAGEGGGQYTVKVADNKIEVTEGFSGEPKCVVNAKSKDFVDVVTGKSNAMMAVLMGKIKMTNQGEMIKYAKIFGLM